MDAEGRLTTFQTSPASEASMSTCVFDRMFDGKSDRISDGMFDRTFDGMLDPSPQASPATQLGMSALTSTHMSIHMSARMPSRTCLHTRPRTCLHTLPDTFRHTCPSATVYGGRPICCSTHVYVSHGLHSYGLYSYALCSYGRPICCGAHQSVPMSAYSSTHTHVFTHMSAYTSGEASLDAEGMHVYTQVRTHVHSTCPRAATLRGGAGKSPNVPAHMLI